MWGSTLQKANIKCSAELGCSLGYLHLLTHCVTINTSMRCLDNKHTRLIFLLVFSLLKYT